MLLLTQSDRVLTTEGGHPSLIDIAVGLSRQPRFGGQTGRWWSVIDHTLFGLELVKQQSPGNRELQLAWMLHDAHEALTGDVPTPFKTPDFKAVQDDLDRRIYGAFFQPGYETYVEFYLPLVKQVDLRAMRAEAMKLLPDGDGLVPQIFGWADEGDLKVLDRILTDQTRNQSRPIERHGRDTPIVDTYIERLLHLL